MKQRVWRPLAAALVRRKRQSSNSDNHPQQDRRIAARTLRTKLPAHLRRDIGADDG